MPDYGRYCPVSMGSEVLADRWTPLVVRELLLGNTRFNDIARCLPGISRSLLVQRLRHLERCGVLETAPSPTGRGSEYHLTPAGKDLMEVIVSLGRWAVTWRHDELEMDDVGAVQLMWWMHRLVVRDALPPGRVVVQFDHTAPVRQSIWLVLDRGEASVCMQHPGFEPDVILTMPTPELAAVFAGATTWREAMGSERIVASGPSALLRALPRWFGSSVWADDLRRQVKLTGTRSA